MLWSSRKYSYSHIYFMSWIAANWVLKSSKSAISLSITPDQMALFCVGDNFFICAIRRERARGERSIIRHIFVDIDLFDKTICFFFFVRPSKVRLFHSFSIYFGGCLTHRAYTRRCLWKCVSSRMFEWVVKWIDVRDSTHTCTSNRF